MAAAYAGVLHFRRADSSSANSPEPCATRCLCELRVRKNVLAKQGWLSLSRVRNGVYRLVQQHSVLTHEEQIEYQPIAAKVDPFRGGCRPPGDITGAVVGVAEHCRKQRDFVVLRHDIHDRW